ncbi:hypothetical protein LOD99_15620 [Oopsacas minuta]|uniref:Band 7 domain-containing protein n=1 Tax=Oopsacas minuta TaxID=111878 RepID=A0AAV7K9H1_9METZ|nr:hypothetical protein LOD99_15620 [Oopsacas minuta]
MAENEPIAPVSVDRSPESQYDNEFRDIKLTGSSRFFTIVGWIIFIAFFPLTMISSLSVLKEYERAIIFRQGRIVSKRAQGPGFVFTLPWVDSKKQIDLRTHVIDVPSQEILTKDSVNANVNAVVFYRIFNPYLSVINVANPHSSTTLLAQSTLRSVLGSKTMFQILTDREKLGDELSSILDEATDPWGIKVESVEMKDISIPYDMKRAMAAEAEATREAKAKAIMANGEWEASKNLREAATILEDAPGALQLRFLQTLNLVAGEKNHTYIFPLPIDLLYDLFKKVN